MESVRERPFVIKLLVIPILVGMLVCLMPPHRSMADSPGNITVFADPAGSSCAIVDQVPGLFTLYVLHTNMDGMVSSDFRVIESSGFHATYVNETVPPIHVGSLQAGISVGYGACVVGPLLLGTITYAGDGTSVPCSTIDVVGNPNSVESSYAWTQSCLFDILAAPQMGSLYVNPQAGQCGPWCALATQPTTWGRVKALYRE